MASRHGVTVAAVLALAACSPAVAPAPAPTASRSPPSEHAARLESLRVEAADFMSYYVNGAKTPRTQAAFPGSTFPGIALRRPAMLGTAPEYEPMPRADDGQRVAPGEHGPAGDGPYLFLDRCPLRDATVTVEGDALMVEFVFVTVYPPGTFPETDAARSGLPVHLPVDAFNEIAAECLSKLEGTVERDPVVGLPLKYKVTVRAPSAAGPCTTGARCALTPEQLRYQNIYAEERGEAGICRQGACIPRMQCAELCAVEVGPSLWEKQRPLWEACKARNPGPGNACELEMEEHPELLALSRTITRRCLDACGFPDFERGETPGPRPP